MVLAGRTVMNYQDQCRTDSPSPVIMALNEIECAITILSEAVDRLSLRTNEIRLPYAEVPMVKGMTPSSLAEPPSSPLVGRLNELRRAINRHTDRLNGLTDEIQL